MNELVGDPDYDARPFVYRELKKYIEELRKRRQYDDWFDFSIDSQYLISKIRELWKWRDRLNKSLSN
jgi:hypothetical protein